MLNAPVGVQRVIGRLRRPSSEPRHPRRPAPQPAMAAADPGRAARSRRSRTPDARSLGRRAAARRPAGPAEPRRPARLGAGPSVSVAAIVLGGLRRQRLRRPPRGPIGGPAGDGPSPPRRRGGWRAARRTTPGSDRRLGVSRVTAALSRRTGRRGRPRRAADEAVAAGPVPRRRHAPQARRRRHDRRGRQGPAPDLQGQVRRHA